MTLLLYVLDPAGVPLLASDPTVYGLGLLDPRRVIGSDLVAIPNGSIWIQTEFIGVDTGDGAGHLWQTLVEWASMLGHSRSLVTYATAAEANAGHAELLLAMQTAASAMNGTP